MYHCPLARAGWVVYSGSLGTRMGIAALVDSANAHRRVGAQLAEGPRSTFMPYRVFGRNITCMLGVSCRDPADVDAGPPHQAPQHPPPRFSPA